MTQVIENTKKYRSVIIDTINQVQQDKYTELLKNKGKAGFDEWKDFGVEVLDLYKFCRELDDNVVMVQILGYEGSGKTCGVMYLDPEETCYLNCDKKPITFTNGNKLYPKDNSKKNYKSISSYEDLKVIIKTLHSKKKDGPFIIFVLGHIEDYKSVEGGGRQRLKFLGKMATKNNIEGSITHCYYTKIDTAFSSKSPERYKLEVDNNGFNTARSPMGAFEESIIPNNYQLIVNAILKEEY